MTRTMRRGPAGAPTPDGAGVEMADHDTARQHEGGARASGRATTTPPPGAPSAARPRSIVLGQFAVSDDKMVKITINPAGKASTVEIRMHSRSGGIFFPTAEGLALPIAAAAFVGGHLRDIKKTMRKLLEAGL